MIDSIKIFILFKDRKWRDPNSYNIRGQLNPFAIIGYIDENGLFNTFKTWPYDILHAINRSFHNLRDFYSLIKRHSNSTLECKNI